MTISLKIDKTFIEDIFPFPLCGKTDTTIILFKGETREIKVFLKITSRVFAKII